MTDMIEEKKDKYCVLTCVLNEHCYLYHYIYYYQTLGFDKIYILQDRGQDNLEIDQNDFTIEIQVLPVIYPPGYTNFNKVQYWNSTFMIHKVIKEDWILLCDIDEYLYLHGKTIQQYMESLPMRENIGQAQFPWMCVEHYGEQQENILNSLNINTWHTNDEVKSIVRRDVFIKAVDNHHNIIKNQLENKKIFTLHHQILTMQAKKRYPRFRQPDYYRQHPFMIHFHTRGLPNILVKILSYKYKDKAGLLERIKLVNNINQEQFKAIRWNEKFRLIRFHKRAYIRIPKFEMTLPHIPEKYLIQYDKENKTLSELFQKNQIMEGKFKKLLKNPDIIFS